MSWNEPGDDNKDPWKGRKDKQGPPDLDEAIRSFQEKLGGIFGGGSNSGNSTPARSAKSIIFLLVGAAFLWSLSGFYIVDEGNQGVVTRFGAYTATTDPGLNWHLPSPIESVAIVNVMKQQYIEVGYRTGGNKQTGSVPREALMLTKDENIVDVRLAVTYQIKSAKDYVFNVKDQQATLRQATESVQRGVVGRNDMNFVLLEGRAQIVGDINVELQQILDSYQSGIVITDVNLQDAQPPDQVQAAFEDAIKAREDKERYINEAEAYRNDVVPKARGAAARRIQEAEGYKLRVIAESEGEAARFTKLLVEYKKAPEVTRNRLYLEAMEAVLSATDTVMVDIQGGNNLVYLPLDRLGRGSNRSSNSSTRTRTNTTSPDLQEASRSSRPSSRSRDTRGR